MLWRFLVSLFVYVGFLIPGCVVVKPEIDIFPKSHIVREGEDVVFKCVVSHVPDKEKEPVQWFRKKLGGLGSDRELKHYPRYKFTGDTSLGEYNLLISNAQVSDDDFYECQVTKYGLRSGKVKLTVEAPTKRLLINGAIGQPNMQLDVVQDKETTITCTSDGAEPLAVLRWYKNDVEIIKNVTQADQLNNTIATLRLTPTVNDKNATYICSALNSSDKNEIFRKASLTLNFIVKPTVTLNVSKSLTEGENATASCEAEPQPADTKYRWYFNGSKLAVTGLQLVFMVNKSWHGGTLSCQAENIAGSSDLSSEKLNVFANSTSETQNLSPNIIPIVVGVIAAFVVAVVIGIGVYKKCRKKKSANVYHMAMLSRS